MKHFLLFLLFGSMSICQLSAQITLQSTDYFPALGDTLKTMIDTAPEGVTVTAPGGDQNWNFSALQSGFSQVRYSVDPETGNVSDSYPNADVLVEQEGAGAGYYTSDENAFATIGFSGGDPLGLGFNINAPFDPPYVERWAPLAFFDLRNTDGALRVTLPADELPTELLGELPLTPDSVRVSITSTRTDLIDAWGTLTIPGGTYEVLREKRIEERSVTVETKIGSFPWIDLTPQILELLMIGELEEQTLVSYTFWSNQAKEPIAIINLNADETEIESVEFKDNDVVTNTITVNAQEPAIAVYPNPAMIEARVEFANMPSGNYTLSFFNLAGKRVLANQYYINGYHLAKVNVTQLPKGIYLYTVRDQNGKRLTTNRLIVTKP
ncbi:MAG: T9SS type A sorting domain-containing protein [Bacteroidota bacterium]